MNLLKCVFFQLFFFVACFGNNNFKDLNGHKPRVLVGSPIRQKSQILNEFIVSLIELEKNDLEVDYYFIDDNLDKESKILLKNFSELDHKVVIKDMKADPLIGDQFICNEVTHFWKDSLVWKVAGFKDEIIQYAKNNQYDYLFLIDSDIVLHKKTLYQLMHAQKDIVCNIFWTKWQPNSIPLPQVWLTDTYNLFDTPLTEGTTQEALIASQTKFIEKLKIPGTYEVGGLGACTLINKNALAKPISFKKLSNITFWGEDRHFCIRATALGLKLFVDTHLPAYHIYRFEDLSGIEYFKENCAKIKGVTYPRITLSMIMKNEADHYLRAVLLAAKDYITDAVIIDDASTDNSIEVVQEVLKGIPLRIIKNTQSLFSKEHLLRKLQWDETIKTNPEWIVFLDADQIFENKFKEVIKPMLLNSDADAYAFRLYDFWDEHHYRDDQFWCAHRTYRPFLIRYKPEIDYKWRETDQHCGSFPYNISEFQTAKSNLRLKHYGWAKKDDRINKYKRYMSIDPECKFGWKPQQESILDLNPNLALWIE